MAMQGWRSISARRHRVGAAIAALVLAASIGFRVVASPPSAVVPAHNRADQKRVPPRPPPGDLPERIRKLWDAIVRDDPRLAAEAFFPRDAFLLVKGIADPGRYFDRLRKRYDEDIHELHRRTADLDRAVFDRFELARRGGFVPVRAEANRLPYWASRHSFIHYRVGRRPGRIEVRVLITWDDRWYVIHLDEFR
jgi:hypothetical protein